MRSTFITISVVALLASSAGSAAARQDALPNRIDAAALAAPAASARPADMPPAVAKAATAAQYKLSERSSDVKPWQTTHGG